MNIPIDVLNIIYNYIKYPKDKLSFLSINKSFSKTSHLFFCDKIVEFEYRNCYPKILEDEYSESNPVFKNYKNVYDKKYNIHSELIIHNYKKFIRQNLITSFFSIVFDNIDTINNLIRIPSEITIKTITFRNCEFDKLCTLELRCLTTELIFQKCKNIKIITPFTSITKLKLISSSKLNFADSQFLNITYEMKNSINCVFPKLLRFNKYHFKKYTENKIFQIDNIVFTYDILKHSNYKAHIDFHNDVCNLYENECYANFHVIEFPFINGTVMSTRKVFVYKIENDKLIIKNLAGTSIEILQSDIKTIIIKNCSFKKLKILAKYCVIEIIDCNIETLQTCGYYVTTKIAIINSVIENVLDTSQRLFEIDQSTKINNYCYVLYAIARQRPFYFDCITLLIPTTNEYVTRKVSVENNSTLHIISDDPVVLHGFPKKIITKKYKSWDITLEGNSLLPLSGKYTCDTNTSSKYDIWNIKN